MTCLHGVKLLFSTQFTAPILLPYVYTQCHHQRRRYGFQQLGSTALKSSPAAVSVEKIALSVKSEMNLQVHGCGRHYRLRRVLRQSDQGWNAAPGLPERAGVPAQTQGAPAVDRVLGHRPRLDDVFSLKCGLRC